MKIGGDLIDRSGLHGTTYRDRLQNILVAGSYANVVIRPVKHLHISLVYLGTHGAENGYASEHLPCDYVACLEGKFLGFSVESSRCISLVRTNTAGHGRMGPFFWTPYESLQETLPVGKDVAGEEA